MRPHIVVVDLDGTLCNSAHREHLARAGQWESFHNQLSGDEPWSDVKEIIKMLEMHMTIVVGLTGRNECYRNKTLDWLAKHDVDFDTLLMRPDDNYQSDHELKPELLDQWLSDQGLTHGDVWFILEDRERVTETFRNLGHNVWQVRSPGY